MQGLAWQLTERLENFTRESEIPFRSVQSTMRAVGRTRRLTIPGDGHPTPVTHCLAAKTIHDLIRSLGYPQVQELAAKFLHLSEPEGHLQWFHSSIALACLLSGLLEKQALWYLLHCLLRFQSRH